MILQVLLNSFLVFFILAFIVEACLFLFRIKNARVRYVCRLVPILKLPFDLLVFAVYGEGSVLTLSGICLVSVFFMIKQGMASRRYVKNALWFSTPCKRELIDPQIRDEAQKLKAFIQVCPEIQSPLAVGKRFILLPNDWVEKASQEEFEVAVARELERLKWKDPIFNNLCKIICSIYWWIPTEWWIKRIEEDQELAVC